MTGAKWMWGIAGLSVVLSSIVVVWLVQPWWLTATHGDELKTDVQKYLEFIHTFEGHRDPSVMGQVATGKYLEYLVQVRCVDCPGIQVATHVAIPIFQVLSYSQTISVVGARIEYGWHLVDTSTRMVVGRCHAQAYSTVFTLAHEDGAWKVSDGGEAWGWDRDPVDDSPELIAKYCP